MAVHGGLHLASILFSVDKFNYGCCLLVQKQIFAIVPVLVEELDNWVTNSLLTSIIIIIIINIYIKIQLIPNYGFLNFDIITKIIS